MDGNVLGRRGHRGRRPLAGLAGLAGAGRALVEHSRPLHGARPRRGERLYRAGGQPAHASLRYGGGHVPGGGLDRRRRDHLRAGAQRAGIHVSASGRVHHERARRLHLRRLARSGIRAGRSLPVQREEIRRRPRGDDRGPAQADTRGDRRRLRQHRYRFLDAGRPFGADASTRSSERTTSAPPSCRR